MVFSLSVYNYLFNIFGISLEFTERMHRIVQFGGVTLLIVPADVILPILLHSVSLPHAVSSWSSGPMIDMIQ